METSNKIKTSDITNAIIDLIKYHIIARTELSQNASAGTSIISVTNAFQFKKNDEVVLIDNGYNTPGSIHYQQFEYAIVKEVIDINTIKLKENLNGDWLLSEDSALQKTIAHTPLFPNNILYGDREVIPTNEMAITVETTGVSNEWIYIQGGLSEDYKVRVMIYGKSIESEEGRLILDRYSDAVYTLLNENIHIDINNNITPILVDVNAGTNKIYIEKNDDNLEYFGDLTIKEYFLQDANENTTNCYKFGITNVNPNYNLSGEAVIELTIDDPAIFDFTTSNFAVLIRRNQYVYDSRVDSVNFGQVFKGSAAIRASEINWFGKTVNDYIFPQKSYKVPYFVEK